MWRMVDTRTPLTVVARPAPVVLVPEQTAVIVVDMQNDFASKGGMFELAGIDISGIRAAIAPTKSLQRLLRNGTRCTVTRVADHHACFCRSDNERLR
jgi:hypothetical protein